MKHPYKVTAVWDDKAKVFTSQSNIPGLVVEADTFEEFVDLVESLAPEVLEANVPSAKRPFVFDIESHRILAVA
jgi:Domain of unknown function (DUF1902)